MLLQTKSEGFQMNIKLIYRHVHDFTCIYGCKHLKIMILYFFCMQRNQQILIAGIC